MDLDNSQIPLLTWRRVKNSQMEWDTKWEGNHLHKSDNAF